MSSSFSGLQLEQLKLLSTAEKLGLFSLAERVLTTDPGAISSASIPFFLAAVGDALSPMLSAPTVNPARVPTSRVTASASAGSIRQHGRLAKRLL